MNRFSVSEKVLNDVLAYLSKRPFSEVVALIQALQGDAQQIVKFEDTQEKPAGE